MSKMSPMHESPDAGRVVGKFEAVQASTGEVISKEESRSDSLDDEES